LLGPASGGRRLPFQSQDVWNVSDSSGPDMQDSFGAQGFHILKLGAKS
jgi:hypothetical protein